MERSPPRNGRTAEERACLFLKFLGWHIVARNVRIAHEPKTGEKRVGEIDIIAYRQAVIAFIEVKARPHIDDAVQAISPRQQRRIASTQKRGSGLIRICTGLCSFRLYCMQQKRPPHTYLRRVALLGKPAAISNDSLR